MWYSHQILPLPIIHYTQFTVTHSISKNLLDFHAPYLDLPSNIKLPPKYPRTYLHIHHFFTQSASRIMKYTSIQFFLETFGNSLKFPRKIFIIRMLITSNFLYMFSQLSSTRIIINFDYGIGPWDPLVDIRCSSIDRHGSSLYIGTEAHGIATCNTAITFSETQSFANTFSKTITNLYSLYNSISFFNSSAWFPECSQALLLRHVP
jgi:hypothetical protein